MFYFKVLCTHNCAEHLFEPFLGGVFWECLSGGAYTTWVPMVGSQWWDLVLHKTCNFKIWIHCLFLFFTCRKPTLSIFSFPHLFFLLVTFSHTLWRQNSSVRRSGQSQTRVILPLGDLGELKIRKATISFVPYFSYNMIPTPALLFFYLLRVPTDTKFSWSKGKCSLKRFTPRGLS